MKEARREASGRLARKNRLDSRFPTQTRRRHHRWAARALAQAQARDLVPDQAQAQAEDLVPVVARCLRLVLVMAPSLLLALAHLLEVEVDLPPQL